MSNSNKKEEKVSLCCGAKIFKSTTFVSPLDGNPYYCSKCNHNTWEADGTWRTPTESKEEKTIVIDINQSMSRKGEVLHRNYAGGMEELVDEALKAQKARYIKRIESLESGHLEYDTALVDAINSLNEEI